jgi:hypothetical protein
LNQVDSDVYSWQAVKTAVHMLENGATIEEAKAFCAPYELFQIAKWKVHETIGHSYDSWHAHTNLCIRFILQYLGLYNFSVCNS